MNECPWNKNVFYCRLLTRECIICLVFCIRSIFFFRATMFINDDVLWSIIDDFCLFYLGMRLFEDWSCVKSGREEGRDNKYGCILGCMICVHLEWLCSWNGLFWMIIIISVMRLDECNSFCRWQKLENRTKRKASFLFDHFKTGPFEWRITGFA